MTCLYAQNTCEGRARCLASGYPSPFGAITEDKKVRIFLFFWPSLHLDATRVLIILLLL
jgi:hypothetical protein